MKLSTRRKLTKLIALGVLCSVPVAAYAATTVYVRVNNQPTNYRAIIVNGTTYVALRDVAHMTGRDVSYDARTRTVNISGGGAASPNNSGSGGTTQRAGNEGAYGALLTTPEAGLRVSKTEVVTEYGDQYTVVRGIIRNTSNRAVTYSLQAARLVLKDGSQIDMSLGANEVGGGSYAGLNRGEETPLQIMFKGAYTVEDIDRVVVTLGVDSNPKVFRVKY